VGVENEFGFGDDEVAVGDGVVGDYKVPLLSLEPVDSVREGQVGHIAVVVSIILRMKPSELWAR
jgi:hypothetical protein